MKKVLALMLVLGMASMASATVMSVVTYDVGQSEGRTGTSTDPLMPSDVLGLKIILEFNPYDPVGGTWPSYDGYNLSSFDLDLEVSGPATLDTAWVATMTGTVRSISSHSGLGVFDWSHDVVDNAIEQMSGLAPAAGLPSEDGGIDIVWDIMLHCDGYGEVTVDLTLHGLSEYSPLSNAGNGPYPDPPGWLAMVEGDLGDLVVHQVPEPMTIALLGLGGLFLRRRR
jgi:hypothetical protein